MSTALSKIYTHAYHKLMREFPLHKIRSKKDAEAATAILDKRFREKFDDPGEEEYFLILADLLADYEEEHQSRPTTVTALDTLHFYMDQHNLRQADISEVLGVGQSAVSMILSGTRPLTAEHARKLGKRFAIQPGRFI